MSRDKVPQHPHIVYYDLNTGWTCLFNTDLFLRDNQLICETFYQKLKLIFTRLNLEFILNEFISSIFLEYHKLNKIQFP